MTMPALLDGPRPPNHVVGEQARYLERIDSTYLTAVVAGDLDGAQILERRPRLVLAKHLDHVFDLSTGAAATERDVA